MHLLHIYFLCNLLSLHVGHTCLIKRYQAAAGGTCQVFIQKTCVYYPHVVQSWWITCWTPSHMRRLSRVSLTLHTHTLIQKVYIYIFQHLCINVDRSAVFASCDLLRERNARQLLMRPNLGFVVVQHVGSRASLWTGWGQNQICLQHVGHWERNSFFRWKCKLLSLMFAHIDGSVCLIWCNLHTSNLFSDLFPFRATFINQSLDLFYSVLFY